METKVVSKRFSDLFDIVKGYFPDAVVKFFCVTDDQFLHMYIFNNLKTTDIIAAVDSYSGLIESLVDSGVNPDQIKFIQDDDPSRPNAMCNNAAIGIIVFGQSPA